jgi:hypothetical protein
MLMPVMDVRHMRMGVRQRQVRVLVNMRFGTLGSVVLVLMVLVVAVLMTVRQIFMRVSVPVLFGQYQPCRNNHKQQSQRENAGKGLIQNQHRNRRAYERRSAEMRAGARAPQMAQRVDEQHQADAVAE